MRLSTSIAVFAASATVLHGAAHAEAYRLAIPAGTLGQALASLGRQAHVSIGVSDPQVANIRVKGLFGSFTVERALSRLLRGKPARPIAVGSRTFIVVAAPPPKRILVRRQRPSTRPANTASTAVRPAVDMQEIIVTGSKRETPLAAFPGPVTVIGEEALIEGQGLKGSDALVSRLPIVTSTYLGPGRNKLFLRGIADSSFNGPTQATVAQYFGDARINFTAPDPDLQLYDFDQIELIPGPQATLYGAGSLGGVIRVVPNAPQLDRVAGRLSIGGSATWNGRPGYDGAGVLNVPLINDVAAVRLVGYRSIQGGYIDDVWRKLRDINDVKIWGARSSFRAVFADHWIMDITGLAQRIRADDAQYSKDTGEPLKTAGSIQQNHSNSYSLLSTSIRKRDGPLQLSVTGAITRQSVHERYDATLEKKPRVFDQSTDITLRSVEGRVWPARASGFRWLAGATLTQNHFTQERSLGLPGSPNAVPGLRNRQTETAVFGEFTLPLIASLTLTSGARLAHASISGGPIDPAAASVRQKQGQTFFLPSIGLSGRPLRDLLVYGRYQQGFRPAGFAIFGDIVQRFRSDRMKAVEAGLRFAPRSKSLEVDGSVAYTRWDDIQADSLDLSGLPATINIGNGRIYTASLQLSWHPVSSLEIEAAGVFNNSRVTNPLLGIIGVVHSTLPNVARFNGRVGARQTMRIGSAVDLTFSGAGHYVGKSRLGAGAVLGRDQGGWLQVDLGAEVSWARGQVTLSVLNLLNSAANRFAFGSPFTISENDPVTPVRPRTLRLGCDIRF